MKETRIIHNLVFLVLLVLIAATACVPSLSQQSAATDAQDIVATVAARVESELSQQGEVVPAVYAVTPASTTGQEAESLQDTLTRLYQEVNPSVVYIVVSSSASGSGFVYSQDGYVVTNHHVVAAGRSYEVVFAGGERRR